MKIKIKIFPFAKIAKTLGKHNKTTNNKQEYSFPQTTITQQLSLSLKKVCKHLPWESSCYNQALIAAKILSWYKISYTIYFGLQKSSGTMRAHAWVKANNQYFCGYQGSEKFKVVACFTKKFFA